MLVSRSRVLGALVYSVVAVTALGTPVLAGTAALGAGGAAHGPRGSATTASAAESGAQAVPAAFAANSGAPAAPLVLTGDRALDAIASGAVTVNADSRG